MALDELAARVSAYRDALRTRGVDAPALEALCRFLERFAYLKPKAFLEAAARTVDGAPLPDAEGAVSAAAAAAELDAMAPLLTAWRAPRSTVSAAHRLAAFFRQHPDWSLRSIEILTAEQLKRDAA